MGYTADLIDLVQALAAAINSMDGTELVGKLKDDINYDRDYSYVRMMLEELNAKILPDTIIEISISDLRGEVQVLDKEGNTIFVLQDTDEVSYSEMDERELLHLIYTEYWDVVLEHHNPIPF